MLSQFSTFPVTLKLGTGYDYPDLPGLGNNKFRMKVYNKIVAYKNKSTTTINMI
jgi:hypothetical protein